MEKDSAKGSLQHYLSPLGAWALAFGCAVGWGSFVMPGNVFLPLAGPLGTVIGMLIGAGLLMILGANYHFLINRYPDAGGAFTYTKKIFGYDHGFLCAWFLVLTYMAVVWANATALPLITRNLFGDLLQFGWSYQIAGFDIYMGEVMLAVAALVITGLLCMRGRAAGQVQILMALILICGIIVCFIACCADHEGGMRTMEPAFAPGRSSGKEIMGIVFLAPWAYIGFESISHSAGEFGFSARKAGGIMIAALLTAGAAYAMLSIVAVTRLPEGFDSWTDYIANLGNLEGVAGLPTFFATESAMGKAGIAVLGVTALGGIITGLVGNYIASSRLIYAMAEDDLLPGWFGRIGRGHAPNNALLFIMLISLIMPFFGRTATGWIVDVTTVGAAMVYAYVSAAAMRSARESGSRLFIATGLAGMVVAMAFLLWFLIPNIMNVAALGSESYFILAAWSVLGFVVFRLIFKRDIQRRFGQSTIVWIVLLGLIYFTSAVWLRQATKRATDQAIEPIHDHYVGLLEGEGATLTPQAANDATEFIQSVMYQVSHSMALNLLIQTAFVVLALIILFNIYTMLMNREKQAEAEKVLAEESSRAKTSFLSNMSHEIRTPMNAIIGLDNIALRDPDLPPKTREQLEKIGASAHHLLGLINDILDMSRIESGRMVLKNEDFVFEDFLNQINVIINGQCQEKGLDYECSIVGQVADYYVGDDMKLKQVLINILGNSVKFTEPPGTVSFAVEQIGRDDGRCSLRFTMKDTGIGMDEEYIPKLFEAFTQEDATTTNRYGGSGLGMAITKNIVEMMDGRIDVKSKKGVGSTFTVTVSLGESAKKMETEDLGDLMDDLRVIVIDDDAVGCEHARLVLENAGISADVCERSADAYSLIRRKWDEGDPYDLVLTDYKMPVMDGITLTKEIRRFDGGRTGIIVMTGYDFEDMDDDARRQGVDGILSKPLFADSLLREIRNAVQTHRKKDDGRVAFGEEAEAHGAAGASGVAEGSEAAEAAADRASGTAEAPGIAGASGPEPSAETDEAPGVDLEGLRVLMAEDVDLNAEILSDLLEMEDVESERAENGRIAVDMFGQSEPGYYDAILMDIRMPEMDGLAATETIRAMEHPDAKTIPIIAMTANAFDEDVQNSLSAGMNAHLSKPIDPDQLYATLGELAKRGG